jgi:hypothetical protein
MQINTLLSYVRKHLWPNHGIYIYIYIYIDASFKNTCSHGNSKVLQCLSLRTNLDSQSNVGTLQAQGGWKDCLRSCATLHPKMEVRDYCGIT